MRSPNDRFRVVVLAVDNKEVLTGRPEPVTVKERFSTNSFVLGNGVLNAVTGDVGRTRSRRVPAKLKSGWLLRGRWSQIVTVGISTFEE